MQPTSNHLSLGSAHFTVDPLGALYWPEKRLLIVADLHLEKGSAYAARKIFLPPYDTSTTLATLAALIARHAPRRVLALGDFFMMARLATGSSRRIAPRSQRYKAGANGFGFPAIMIRSFRPISAATAVAKS